MILPIICVDDVARLVMGFGDPPDEFLGIRNSGREKYEPNFMGKKDNALFPHHPSLFISHVVDLANYTWNNTNSESTASYIINKKNYSFKR